MSTMSDSDFEQSLQPYYMCAEPFICPGSFKSDNEDDDDFSDEDVDSDSDEEHFFNAISRFKRDKKTYGPLVRAVIENDVNALKKFAETTELHKFVQPKTGDTLLHIAVKCGRKEVFDYFLSLAIFPIEQKNTKGDTVLSVCWDGSYSVCGHFACELIKKGASMECVALDRKEILLHYAIDSSYVDLSKLLMEMGYDVNTPDKAGTTPLWLCIIDTYYEKGRKEQTEMATALLCYGADPMLGTHKNYNLFEYVMFNCSSTLQEALFYSVIDEYTSMDVHFEILLVLSYRSSPFFRDTLSHTKDVIVAKSSLYCHHLIFSIDIDDLDALIQKCPDAIRTALHDVKLMERGRFFEKKFLENLNRLVESDVRDDAMFFIARMNRYHAYFNFLMEFPADNPAPLQHLCFLLSYGLRLSECHVEDLYREFGFGELFKILLHMDVKPSFEPYSTSPMLHLFFNVNCDLQKILAKADQYSYEDLREMLHYFADPRLRALGSNHDVHVPSVVDQPDVPLLSELARNVFRKFFIKTFDIKSAGQFYKLVTRLPVAAEHKKIITFEKELY